MPSSEPSHATRPLWAIAGTRWRRCRASCCRYVGRLPVRVMLPAVAPNALYWLAFTRVATSIPAVLALSLTKHAVDTQGAGCTCSLTSATAICAASMMG